jgi:hypothetical protein
MKYELQGDVIALKSKSISRVLVISKHETTDNSIALITTTSRGDSSNWAYKHKGACRIACDWWWHVSATPRIKFAMGLGMCMYLRVIILVGAYEADLAILWLGRWSCPRQDPGALADWAVATAREDSGWMPAAAIRDTTTSSPLVPTHQRSSGTMSFYSVALAMPTLQPTHDISTHLSDSPRKSVDLMASKGYSLPYVWPALLSGTSGWHQLYHQIMVL